MGNKPSMSVYSAKKIQRRKLLDITGKLDLTIEQLTDVSAIEFGFLRFGQENNLNQVLNAKARISALIDSVGETKAGAELYSTYFVLMENETLVRSQVEMIKPMFDKMEKLISELPKALITDAGFIEDKFDFSAINDLQKQITQSQKEYEEVQKLISDNSNKWAQKFEDLTRGKSEAIENGFFKYLKDHPNANYDQFIDSEEAQAIVRIFDKKINDVARRFVVPEDLEEKAKTLSSVIQSGLKKLDDLTKFMGDLSKSSPTSLSVLNATIRQVSGALETLLDPINTTMKSLDFAYNVIKNGYKAEALRLVQSGDVIEFLNDVRLLVDSKVEANAVDVSKKVDELVTILNSGLEETVMQEKLAAKAVEWMKPSVRFLIGTEEKYQVAFAKLSQAEDLLKLGYVPALISAVAKRSAALLASRLSAAGEALVGERIATAVVSLASDSAIVIGKFIGIAMSWEVQVAITIFYAFIDAFKAHNAMEWARDVLGFITCGLTDLNVSFHLHVFPPLATVLDKKNVKGVTIPKLWEIDHKEFTEIYNFWCKHYLDELGKLDNKQYTFKNYPDFDGIYVRHGLYINPQHSYPYPQDYLDACIQIEKEIDLGIAVDDQGYISQSQEGVHLMDTVLPRQKGLVRNLKAFPLYRSTVAWPDTRGEFLQTKGNWNEDEVDPNIMKRWTEWATQGNWGPIYNNPHSSPAVIQKAIEVNKQDFNDFMHPDPSHDIEWAVMRNWINSNAGIKKMMSQQMYKINMKTFDDELKREVELGKDEHYRLSYDRIVYLETKIGRLPWDKYSLKTYEMIVKEKKTYHRVTEAAGGIIMDVWVRDDVSKSTYERILLFYKQMKNFRDALEKTHNDIQKAWEIALHDTLWEVYIKETTPRTIFGYITRYKTQFIQEIQLQTNLMLGDRKASVWQEFINQFHSGGIPLDINRFGRLEFAGQLNQLVYSNTSTKEQEITKILEKFAGKLAENTLITTGTNDKDRASWAQGINVIDQIKTIPGSDFPVYFGNLHCRIVVITKPKPTMFIVFRGTTNMWEWVVDADFSASELLKVNIDQKTGVPSLIDAGVVFGKENRDPEDIYFENTDYFFVHRGFLRCWKTFKPELMKYVNLYYQKYQLEDVIITGHSLGAGITQIAALEFPSLNKNGQFERPHTYMFSSPKVGDIRFTYHFNTLTAESAQVYVDGDVVTMIPPFLLPSKETWGKINFEKEYADFMKYIEQDNKWATGIYLISRVFEYFKIPINPQAWTNKQGEIDWNQVQRSAVELSIATTKGSAYRAGGVFFRIEPTFDGTFYETQTDSNTSAVGVQILTHAKVGKDELIRRHSIDNIVKALDTIYKRNKDLFRSIEDTEFPDWGQAGSTKIDYPVPKIPNLKTMNPGRVIAFARSKRPYLPGCIVDKEDVDMDSIIMVPDVDNIERKRGRQVRRQKIRKTTESDYHGY